MTCRSGLVLHWLIYDDTPKQVGGEWTSVYLPRIINGRSHIVNEYVGYLLTCVIGPPTQGHVYQKLVQAERIAELAGQSAVGDAQMVNITLDIECQQYF